MSPDIHIIGDQIFFYGSKLNQIAHIKHKNLIYSDCNRYTCRQDRTEKVNMFRPLLSISHSVFTIIKKYVYGVPSGSSSKYRPCTQIHGAIDIEFYARLRLMGLGISIATHMHSFIEEGRRSTTIITVRVVWSLNR